MKKLFSLFLDHPSSVNETYFEHLVQAMLISLNLLKLSITALTHAIFPFLFIETTSLNIEKLNNKTSKRRKKTLASSTALSKDPRFIRKSIYNYGSIIIECKEKGIIYESEYCSEEKKISESRILWIKTLKDGLYLVLPPESNQYKNYHNLNNETIAFYENAISENNYKKPALSAE
ncbi:MAG: hypothetical protein CMD65_03395 [Gammaproteobacteria bacterium]|nr:hypothetical protein [Gammaproteobacteria bacterium]